MSQSIENYETPGIFSKGNGGFMNLHIMVV